MIQVKSTNWLALLVVGLGTALPVVFGIGVLLGRASCPVVAAPFEVEIGSNYVLFPLQNGDGELDGRKIRFYTTPHGFAKYTNSVYAVQYIYPNGEWYNTYPTIPPRWPEPAPDKESANEDEVAK